MLFCTCHSNIMINISNIVYYHSVTNILLLLNMASNSELSNRKLWLLRVYVNLTSLVL
ncbi:hypothetical protein CCP4SC76_4470007 [Gammaproteobacteria bacterium]